MSKLLTTEEVATYLNKDRQAITRLARLGELKAYKVAGSWRFKSADVENYLERNDNTFAGKL